MSMSMHVVGIRPANEEYQKMLAVHDACTAAQVPVPVEVDEFFDGVLEPERDGMLVDLRHPSDPPSILREWRNDHCEGYEVDIADVPQGVTTLRFYASW